MPDWVLNCAVVTAAHSDRRPNHLTSPQLLLMVLRTCKRCIRTGVNDLSGLYSGASPYHSAHFARNSDSILSKQDTVDFIRCFHLHHVTRVRKEVNLSRIP